jgi:hypothetical protein
MVMPGEFEDRRFPVGQCPDGPFDLALDHFVIECFFDRVLCNEGVEPARLVRKAVP